MIERVDMKKILLFISVILITVLSTFTVSAESWGTWASRPVTNNLSSIAQDRYCSTIYPNLDDYDFIAYYTVSHSWLDANTLLYGTATYSGTSWTFEGYAWNDNDSEPEYITLSRGFSWDDNNDFIYKYLAYENYDSTDVLNVCDGSQPSIVPPNLTLPTPNVPNTSYDSEQSTYIQSISSPSVQGGTLNMFVIDYYNIYSVVQTAETDQFFDSINDNYYIYQESSGKYIYPVYDRSVLTVYAPNFSVSSQPFGVMPYILAQNSYSYTFSDGVIQRDINKFEYEFVDYDNTEDFSTLPFDNSSENQNHVEYLGTKATSYFIGTSSSSMSITLNNGGITVRFYFAVSDKYDTIQVAINNNNQTIIDNNMNSGFQNLDNLMQSGNSISQSARDDLNSIRNQFDSTYNYYESLENQLISDYNNNLDSIDLDSFKISDNINLLNTSNFVKTQFDRITTNSPFGLVIGFSLCVGLALLLIGKRL